MKVTGFRLSGQDIRHSDPAHLPTVNNHRDILTGLIVDMAPVDGRSLVRVRVDLDLVIAEVDDPVDRDAGPSIALELLAPVVVQAGHPKGRSHLDHQATIC